MVSAAGFGELALKTRCSDTWWRSLLGSLVAASNLSRDSFGHLGIYQSALITTLVSATLILLCPDVLYGGFMGHLSVGTSLVVPLSP